MLADVVFVNFVALVNAGKLHHNDAKDYEQSTDRVIPVDVLSQVEVGKGNASCNAQSSKHGDSCYFQPINGLVKTVAAKELRDETVGKQDCD